MRWSKEVEAVEYLEKETVSIRQQISRLMQIFQQLQGIEEAKEPLNKILSIADEVSEALALVEQKRRYKMLTLN
ncbi:hypothetical protein [Thermodesulfovibrio thiophilus]|uniref:hypothetical protein n=1 Tax=Thermodesulfovibrio thiophilus TaxID=340095 RepID=UPI001840FB90|nr:hypothetical protein [Thermodesulfovibrio thiophilus]HHW20450.1 hypothetical protein [Thermodesulfovibrio thiophilus]